MTINTSPLANSDVESLMRRYGLEESNTKSSSRVNTASKARLGHNDRSSSNNSTTSPTLNLKNLRKLRSGVLQRQRSSSEESSSPSSENQTLKKLNKAFWKTAAIATSILCYTVVAAIVLVPTAGLLTPIAPAILIANPALITVGSITLPFFMSLGKSMRTTNNHMFWNTLKKKGLFKALKVHWKNMKVDSGKAYLNALKEGFVNYPKYLSLAAVTAGAFGAIFTGKVDVGFKKIIQVYDGLSEKEFEDKKDDRSLEDDEAEDSLSVDSEDDEDSLSVGSEDDYFSDDDEENLSVGSEDDDFSDDDEDEPDYL